MTRDEQGFLAAIEASPDDEAPHKVFADWLDEHDRPEEADWHRAWTTAEAKQAREWFEEFAKGHHHNPNYGYHSEESDWKEYTAAEIIEAGRVWLSGVNDPYGNGWGKHTTQMGGESLRDEMFQRHTREEFWRNWSLATGVFVPTGVAEDGYVFSCSC